MNMVLIDIEVKKYDQEVLKVLVVLVALEVVIIVVAVEVIIVIEV